MHGNDVYILFNMQVLFPAHSRYSSHISGGMTMPRELETIKDLLDAAAFTTIELFCFDRKATKLAKFVEQEVGVQVSLRVHT